jgi:hypothetical protein
MRQRRKVGPVAKRAAKAVPPMPAVLRVLQLEAEFLSLLSNLSLRWTNDRDLPCPKHKMAERISAAGSEVLEAGWVICAIPASNNQRQTAQRSSQTPRCRDSSAGRSQRRGILDHHYVARFGNTSPGRRSGEIRRVAPDGVVVLHCLLGCPYLCRRDLAQPSLLIRTPARRRGFRCFHICAAIPTSCDLTCRQPHSPHRCCDR